MKKNAKRAKGAKGAGAKVKKHPVVAIMMGSDSDWAVMSRAAERLESFAIPYTVRVLSAHRSPEETAAFASGARDAGYRVLICGAGLAAHLAGAVSAQTTLPVLAVPLDAGGLGGLDALLATVQMPGGIPVGTLAVGKAGAENAAILAAQILALGDDRLAKQLVEHKRGLARGVAEKDRRLQTTLGGGRARG